MKIYAFTDLHGNKKALAQLKKNVKKEKPTLILCMGDLTVFESSMTTLLKEVDKIGLPVIMLHGNHESASSLRAACKKTKHITFLHKAIKKINGYTFAAYGGGGFDEKDPKLETQIKKWKEIEWKKTIFLSHAPPYKTTLDDVGEFGEEWHVGSKTLRKMIKRKKPLLLFAGHIHECFETTDRIGRTLIENPGPVGKVYDLEELD